MINNILRWEVGVIVTSRNAEMQLAPMMTLLGKGTLRVTRGTEERRFTVEGGFLQVVDDVVRIVTEQARAEARS